MYKEILPDRWINMDLVEVIRLDMKATNEGKRLFVWNFHTTGRVWPGRHFETKQKAIKWFNENIFFIKQPEDEFGGTAD